MEGPFFGAHLSAFDFENDADLMVDKNGVYAHCPSAGGAGGRVGGRRRCAVGGRPLSPAGRSACRARAAARVVGRRARPGAAGRRWRRFLTVARGLRFGVGRAPAVAPLGGRRV